MGWWTAPANTVQPSASTTPWAVSAPHGSPEDILTIDEALAGLAAFE
jgi:hypothetical protein